MRTAKRLKIILSYARFIIKKRDASRFYLKKTKSSNVDAQVALEIYDTAIKIMKIAWNVQQAVATC